MEALNAAALPVGALLLVDSAPIIYTLEANGRFAAHSHRCLSGTRKASCCWR
jgi:hypothetical protein